MQIEEKKYKPTPEAIESEINDIYVEDMDLEEYRHRFRNSDFQNQFLSQPHLLNMLILMLSMISTLPIVCILLYAYLLWKHLSCLIEYKKSLQSWDSGRFI